MYSSSFFQALHGRRSLDDIGKCCKIPVDLTILLTFLYHQYLYKQLPFVCMFVCDMNLKYQYRWLLEKICAYGVLICLVCINLFVQYKIMGYFISRKMKDFSPPFTKWGDFYGYSDFVWFKDDFIAQLLVDTCIYTFHDNRIYLNKRFGQQARAGLY